MVLQRLQFSRVNTTTRQILPVLPVAIQPGLPTLRTSTLLQVHHLRANSQTFTRAHLGIFTRSGRHPIRVQLTRMFNRPPNIIQSHIHHNIRNRRRRPIVRHVTITFVITGAVSFTTNLQRRHDLTRRFIRMLRIRWPTQFQPLSVRTIFTSSRFYHLLTRNHRIFSGGARQHVLVTTLLNRIMINRRALPRTVTRLIGEVSVSHTRTRALNRDRLIRKLNTRRRFNRRRSFHTQNSIRRHQTIRQL